MVLTDWRRCCEGPHCTVEGSAAGWPAGRYEEVAAGRVAVEDAGDHHEAAVVGDVAPRAGVGHEAAYRGVRSHGGP